jgi:glycolate oxidase iron-sulfur subunit
LEESELSDIGTETPLDVVFHPSGAWDERKPPEPDLISDCVHCGFCLPTCPTYVLWGEEMDSPRGRIQLMTLGHQEGTDLSDEIVTHLDNCLGCMSCVTACPSGVQYGKLIEDARQQIERNHARSVVERLYRGLIFQLFPHPGRLRALAPMLVLQKKLGLDKVAVRLPKVGTLAGLAPDVTVRQALRVVPKVTKAKGEKRATVGFLQGCVQRVFFGDVNRATLDVLAAEGFEVHSVRQRCCGALQLHAGDDPGAMGLAKATIEAFEKFDIVVTNAAGCGSAMKDYEHALRQEGDGWAERAKAFSAKVRDISELLTEFEPRAERHPVGLDRVAYHDACHLAHAQGIRAEPRALLRAIPGLQVVEPREWEICCGSAGVYNLLKPEPARELGKRKLENLRATGTDVIVAANPGCALQINSAATEEGAPLRILHPIEVLAASIAKRSLNA